MIQEGIEAIIIKVASAGLTTKHLGMTLKEVIFADIIYLFH
jgi:diphthamide synthase (EF-2-diphthine--ammonia ligase)